MLAVPCGKHGDLRLSCLSNLRTLPPSMYTKVDECYCPSQAHPGVVFACLVKKAQPRNMIGQVLGVIELRMEDRTLKHSKCGEVATKPGRRETFFSLGRLTARQERCHSIVGWRVYRATVGHAPGNRFGPCRSPKEGKRPVVLVLRVLWLES